MMDNEITKVNQPYIVRNLFFVLYLNHCHSSCSVKPFVSFPGLPYSDIHAAATMTTILEQVQIQNNPVLDAMYAQQTAMKTAQMPEKMRATSTQVATRKQIKNKNQVNADCNCYESETVDYRSFIRKPEFIM